MALLLFEQFGLPVGGEGVDDLIEIAVHHGIQLIQGQTDAVIGQSSLREIVSSDALIAHAGADLAAALSGIFVQQFLLLFLLQT